MKLWLIVAMFMPALMPAQIVEEHYFSDPENGDLDMIYDYIRLDDGVLIAGMDTTGIQTQPLIMKINTDGTLAWSTIYEHTFDFTNVVDFKISLFEDGFIYGVLSRYSPLQGHYIHLWKVDAAAGELIYAEQLPGQDNFYFDISDYNADSYYITYEGQASQKRIGHISKEDGSMLDSYDFAAYSLNNFEIESDGSGNVYLATADTVYKCNSNHFDQFVWKNAYGSGDTTLSVIRELYLDRYGDIFLFGGKETVCCHMGLIVKVDPQDGHQVWFSEVHYTRSVTDFQDRNGKIYATYSDGSSGTYFHTSKINKATGNVEWNSYVHPVPPDGGLPEEETESARSIDVDCDGDVYITGYYDASGPDYQCWATIKLDGDNGAKIYDRTILPDTTNQIHVSIGLASCVVGNEPLFLGLKANDSNDIHAYYARLNPNTGGQDALFILGGGFKFHSRTIEMINEEEFTYTLKKTGRTLMVEKLNQDFEAVWQREIMEDYFEHALMTSWSGDLYVMAKNYPLADTLPLYELQADSLRFYKISKTTGDVLANAALQIDSLNFKGLEIQVDLGRVYFVIEQSDTMLYGLWDMTNPPVVSAAFGIYGDNENYYGKQNVMLMQSGNWLMLAASDSLYRVNKLTLEKTAVIGYDGVNLIRQINEINGRYYLTGQNENDQPILLEIDTTTWSVSNSFIYPFDGAYTQMQIVSEDSLLLLGDLDGQIGLSFIHLPDGEVIWNHFTNIAGEEFTYPYEMAVDTVNGKIAISGSGTGSGDGFDAVIELLDWNGDPIFSYIGYDDYGHLSQANTAEIIQDSACWVGGALNEAPWAYRGYIFELYNDFMTIDIPEITSPAGTSAFKIYPNPVHEMFSISGVAGNCNFLLVDNTGRGVKRGTITIPGKFDVSDLANGMYSLILQKNNDAEILRLIKE